MSSKNSPTRVAISAGDPNGIGIETVVKSSKLGAKWVKFPKA